MAIDLNEGVSAQFDVARQRAAQGENAQLQRQRDALARRSAQLGGGPSGALIKQEGIAANESGQRLANANEGIAAAQTGEERRIREIKQGQEFQTGERVGSQDFAAGQREAQNKFSSQEAVAARAAAEESRVAQNQYAAQQQAAQSDFVAHQTKIAQDIQASQFGQTLARDNEKFQHEIAVDDFNMKLATQMANEKDPLEKLLSPQDRWASWGGAISGGGKSAGGSLSKSVKGVIGVRNPRGGGII